MSDIIKGNLQSLMKIHLVCLTSLLYQFQCCKAVRNTIKLLSTLTPWAGLQIHYFFGDKDSDLSICREISDVTKNSCVIIRTDWATQWQNWVKLNWVSS